MTSIIAVSFCLVYYIATIWMFRNIRFSTKDICVCGLIMGLTLLLETIRIPLPTGATMSLCGPLPLLLCALVWDKRMAIIAGIGCGILIIFTTPSGAPIHWAQIPVEHLICYSSLGYAGVFGNKTKGKVACGLLLGSAIKMTSNTISGAVFFGQYAWAGWNPWAYSLVYNLSQNIPLYMSCVIILALPLRSIQRTIGKEVAQ